MRTAGRDLGRESRLAAVYVHYDRRGLIHDYVVHQLRELVVAGFEITFVTNSPIFPEASCDLVVPFCRNVISRLNSGYDFGAYKDGIEAIGELNNLDALVLMNDSVYGPFWPLSETLSTIDRSKVDFWGVVDSYELDYHIQSFFMVFFSNTLRNAAFTTFWNRLPYVNNKGWVIRNAEVGLSQALIGARLRSGVLAPFWSVAEKMKDRLRVEGIKSNDVAFNRLSARLLRGRGVNPMHYFWDILIIDYRCPFIKRELIKLNPIRLSGLSRWSDLIRSTSSYDTAMIDRHTAS